MLMMKKVVSRITSLLLVCFGFLLAIVVLLVYFEYKTFPLETSYLQKCIRIESAPNHATSTCDDVISNLPKNYASILPKKYGKVLPVRTPYEKCGKDAGLFQPNIILDKRVWMTFLIKSSRNHVKHRDVVRKTWASTGQMYPLKYNFIFVVGLGEDGEEDKLLLEEVMKYKDIIQCNYIDTYNNLTNKVLSSIRWAVDKLNSTFITSCDDDTIINIPNIDRYFTDQSPRDSFICGLEMRPNQRINRNSASKWYTSPELYDQPIYPAHCTGAMWTAPKSLLRGIYCVSEVTNGTEYFIDDVFVTGILRYKLFGGNNFIMKPKNISLMMYPPLGKDDIRLEYMKRMWKKIIRNNTQVIGNKEFVHHK